MALNDIKVPKENASGTFDETVLTPAQISAAPTSRTITAGTGLTGGGDLTANRTLAVSYGTSAGTACEGNDSRLSDSRTPSAHAASHLPSGADELFDQSLNTADSPTFTSVTLEDGIAQGSLVVYEEGEGSIFDFATDGTAVMSVTPQQVIYYKPLNIVGVNAATHKATTRANLGAAASGSITASGLTQSTARLLGRTTASTGAIEEIQIGSGLSLSAGELSSTVSAGIPATLLDAKGDLIVASAADTAARLPVGATNGHALVVDSAESLGMKWAAVSGVVSGSVDNAILRADGTGGSTSQSSAITIDDAVVAFSVTGVASTDIITATGHNFTANQAVRFPTLTGGSGLTAATTNYFVRDISGDTFKVSTTSGGAAVNFTTDITAGTVIAVQANVTIANVSSETTSALVLTPKGANGALIVGNKPDGTITGGNPRGNGAVDICFNNEDPRSDATRVASGQASTIVGGSNQSASGLGSTVVGGRANTASSGYAIVCGGISNTASASRACVIGGQQNIASNDHAFATGYVNTSSGIYSISFGARAVADRVGLMAHSSGFFNANGDAQRASAVLFAKISSNTLTEIFIAGATHRFTVSSGKTIAAIIHVVATTSGGEFACQYVRHCVIRNRGGTTALRGSVQTIGTDIEDFASCDLSVDADDTTMLCASASKAQPLSRAARRRLLPMSSARRRTDSTTTTILFFPALREARD